LDAREPTVVREREWTKESRQQRKGETKTFYYGEKLIPTAYGDVERGKSGPHARRVKCLVKGLKEITGSKCTDPNRGGKVGF